MPVEDSFKREEPEETPRMKLLRERAERRERLRKSPPAAVAVRKAMAWQRDIEEQGMRRSEIARREGYTRARVTQIMGLVKLPDEVKSLLLAGDDQVAAMTIREAMRRSG